MISNNKNTDFLQNLKLNNENSIINHSQLLLSRNNYKKIEYKLLDQNK